MHVLALPFMRQITGNDLGPEGHEFSVISLPCMANTLSLPLIICHTDTVATSLGCIEVHATFILFVPAF